MVNSLIEQNLVTRQETPQHEATGKIGRPRELLYVNPNKYYTLVLSPGNDCRFLSFLHYGDIKPCFMLKLPNYPHTWDLVQAVNHAIADFCSARQVKRSAFLSQVVVLRASLQQGYDGMVFRDNTLQEVDFKLGQMLTEATAIPTYVCNLAYGHLLGLLAKLPQCDNALVFMAGDGGVGLGFIINKQIMTGPHNCYPECSHLPFPGGFEQALGNYGPHSADALEYGIKILAPIFKFSAIIVSGIALADHEEVIYTVQQRLKIDPNPLMHHFKLSFVPLTNPERFIHFAYLSFDLAIERLNPCIIKRNLQSVLQARYGK